MIPRPHFYSHVENVFLMISPIESEAITCWTDWNDLETLQLHRLVSLRRYQYQYVFHCSEVLDVPSGGAMFATEYLPLSGSLNKFSAKLGEQLARYIYIYYDSVANDMLMYFDTIDNGASIYMYLPSKFSIHDTYSHNKQVNLLKI